MFRSWEQLCRKFTLHLIKKSMESPSPRQIRPEEKVSLPVFPADANKSFAAETMDF